MLLRGLLLCVLMASAVHLHAGTSVESQWTWLGPAGGSLGPFVFSREDPSLVFAASNNGVFRSRDGGTSWDRLASGLTDPNLFSLVRSGSALLAGTYRTGVFRSGDEGETWNPVDLGVADQGVFVLAVDPSDESRIFAGTAESGVLRSEDGGDTWAPANEGLPNLSVQGIAFNPFDSDIVFVSVSTGVFRSADGGDTWVDTLFPREDVPPLQMVVNEQGEPLVASFDGLFILRNQIWSNLLEASPLVSGPVAQIAFHPTNPQEILIAAATTLARSRNGGATWEQVPVANLFNLLVRGLSYHPSVPDRIFVGATGGTFVSSDSGSSWKETRDGLRAGFVAELSIDPGNPLVLFGAGLGGAFKTVSRSEWEPIRGELQGADTLFLGQDATDPNLVFAGNRFGFHRSLDAGLHWKRSVPTAVRAIEAHPTVPGLVFAAVGRGPGLFGNPNLILRSFDSGETFERITGDVVGFPNDILASRTEANRVWVATSQGVFFSNQMGGFWQRLEPGLTDTNVVSLAEGPSGAVFAGTRSGRVFRLDDPEGSWTELTRPTTRAIQGLAASADNAGILYAATDGDGLWATQDGGVEWVQVEGLENPYLRQVRFSRDGRRLYAVGQGGIYELVLNPTDDLGVSIDQEVSGNRFPRGTVDFSIVLHAASAPAGESPAVYRYQQALPLGLQLVEATTESGQVFTGPAFNAITWIGTLQTDVTLHLRAEILDGAQDRDLATQGRLVRLENPSGPESLSDDPSGPMKADATIVTIEASPFRAAGVLAVPRAIPIADTFVGIALLNRTLTPAHVEIAGVAADGTTVESTRLEGTLDHSAQSAMLTSDVLDSGQTAMIESPEVDLQGFFLLGDGQLNRMDGVGGAARDSQRLFLPRVQRDSDLQTYLFLFNPDPANTVQASVEFRGVGGQTQAVSPITLFGHGSIWTAVSEIFPGLRTEDGYLRVEADRPLRGFELVAGDQTFETLPAQPIEYARRFWAPHAFFGGGLGRTRLRLLNTGPRDVRVTVRAFDDTVGLLGEPVVSLASGELQILDLAELFSEDEARQGWLQIDAETAESTVPTWPSLIAAVEYQSEDGTMATTLPMVSQEPKNPTFLQVAQSSNATIFQGLALLQVGATDPIGLLEGGTVLAFDQGGHLLEFAPFGAATRISGLLNQPMFFGSDFHQEGGHLEIFPERSAIVYTIFGGARFLSAVEAQGSALFLY